MRRMLLLGAAAILVVAVGQASATPILKFDDPISPGGSVSYDGSGGPAVGTGILFQTIQGLNTPYNNGVTLTCIGCELNFTTGNNTSEGPSMWTFAGGGSFVLTATAVMDGSTYIFGPTTGPTPLLTGHFTSATVSSSNGSLSFLGFGIDEKADFLGEFFFDDNPDWFTFANTNISLGSATFTDDGGFSATVSNADLNNTAVPEPASLLLLGAGLLGLSGAARRRR